MKELSIEEKAKCYDEAIYNNYKSFNELIERLESVKNVIKKHNYGIAMDILCKPYPKFQITTFTEFKESEDERIRKSLIGHLKECRNNTRSEVMLGEYAKWIVWLEKQGEQKPIKEHNICDTCDEKAGCVDPCPMKLIEQKPADKVEAKFKVGDWLIHNKNIELANSLMLVTGKNNDEYLCRYMNGQCSYNIEFIDKEYHFWTIQDAKDGDVLANNGNIILFKQISDSARPDYKFIQSYCFVLMHSFDFHLNGTYNLNDRFHPAIKEQHDTLMKAMAAAGYEWDVEHKQLKKIEQKSAWSEDDEGIYRIVLGLLGNWSKGTLNGFVIPPTAERYISWFKLLKERVQLQSKQEWSEEEVEIIDWLVASFDCLKIPTDTFYQSKVRPFLISLRNKIQPIINEWSEEDETKIKSIIALLKSPALCTMEGNKGIIDENIKYLKSFRDRVQPQPKQEWSEEDKEHLNRAINILDASKVYTKSPDKYEDTINWLKSLEPQSHWNPSIAQLNALSIVSKGNAPDDIEAIVSLYQDLKKLRKE